MAVPAPQVVVATSVESKFKVTVSVAESVGAVPQVKTLATVSRAVQVVKEESPKVTEELSKRRAPSPSNVPSIYASSPFRETVGAALPTLRLPPKTLNNPAAKRVSVIEPSP